MSRFNTSQSKYVAGLGRNRCAIGSITRQYNYLARTNQSPFCSLFDFNCPSNRILTIPSAPLITSTTSFSTSIEINFTQPSDGGTPITNYEYSLDSGSSWIPFSSTVTGLISGQTYNIQIRAVNSVGAGPASTTVTVTTITVPGAPTNLSVITGDTSIEITFTEPSDGGSPITNYEYSLNGGSSWTSLSPIDATSPVTITGLTNGTVYNIKLRAVNSAGAGVASSQISIAPIPSNSFNPATINGLNLWLDGQYPSSVVISSNRVTSWNDKTVANNNFASSQTGTITYSQPSGINNRPAIYFETSAPTTPTYLSRSFNIAPSNELSLFMVVNHVSTGTSGNSELFFSQIGPTSPGYAYFDLFSITNSTGQLSINIGNQQQFLTSLDIKGTISLINVIATTSIANIYVNGTQPNIYVNGTQTSKDIPRGGLSLNNIIGWAISGGAFKGYVGEIVTYPTGLSNSDRQKVEGYLAWKWGLQANLPNSQPYKNAPPISLNAPVITGITTSPQPLSVAFTQITGGLTITNYQYSTDNGATFRELATPDVTSPLTITTLSSDGTTPLTNGVTYSIIIQAKTANGLSSVSNMVQGTPSIPQPSTPTALSSVGGNTQAYILFTQSGTVTNYEYSTDNGVTFRAFNPPQTYSPVNITTLSSNGVTPLTNGTTYTVKLKAVNYGVSSSESVSVTVMPTTTSLESNGQIIYLDANNSSSYSGSGTTWTNLASSGAYSATLNGSPTFNTTVSGNKYFEFNPGAATGQFAQINQAAAINPALGSPFTIQMWARINNIGSQGSLLSKVFGAPSYDGYALGYKADTTLQLHENGLSRVNYFNSQTDVLSNGWALYTANIQFGNAGGRTNKIFVNGRELVIKQTSNNVIVNDNISQETGILSPTQNLTFPTGFYGEGECDIGQLYYYNTELTTTQVIQNFDATKSRYI